MKRYALLFAFILGCKDCSSPVAPTDIGGEFPTLGTDASFDSFETDAVDDAEVSPSVCPESVRLNSRGEPVGVQSNRVRHCWPGEAHCFCDVDGDCYSLEGYVPCSPLSHDL